MLLLLVSATNTTDKMGLMEKNGKYQVCAQRQVQIAGHKETPQLSFTASEIILIRSPVVLQSSRFGFIRFNRAAAS